MTIVLRVLGEAINYCFFGLIFELMHVRVPANLSQKFGG